MSIQDIVDSNDYVNQVTLNFLISKSQLQKLNKKMNKDIKEDVIVYDKSRILQLFNELLNNERPDDLLEDVKNCFDAFIEKSIYYMDIHDKNVMIDQEREEILDNDDLDNDDNEDLDNEDLLEPVVNKKYTTCTSTNLPVNWFNKSKQNYKMGQIFPRNKEIITNNSI
jgi:transcriptional regulator with GAF, ATPase, and Fis domain